MYDAQLYGSVAVWVGSLGTIVGLVGVAVQVRQARRVAYAQFVHELDKDYRVYYTNTNDDEGTILERVAFFEKVKLLVDQDAVRMATINTMFAGRFFALAHAEITSVILWVSPPCPLACSLR